MCHSSLFFALKRSEGMNLKNKDNVTNEFLVFAKDLNNYKKTIHAQVRCLCFFLSDSLTKKKVKRK